ncbi:O-antigen polysaccharide polymerase Wzy [Aquirufa antheringensis]|uniref:O-antigen polysaccharide polymerase Wzy n=1 Tax=Aquirufa antheringensis TaxID=2516559 RepID=A0A4Q9BG99_9BACT|nr:O-antigen polysaccharide polymerase Wzy [Aquirufa antheringensis]TBH75056.1 O-antigen polysaccharide polymerase Wzy [Aquirufa antheringensis]
MASTFNILIFVLYLFFYFLISNNLIDDFGGYIYLSAPIILIIIIILNYRRYKSIFHILNIFNFSSLLFFFGSPLINLFLAQENFILESIVVKEFSKRDLDFCSIIVLISLSVINFSSGLNINFLSFSNADSSHTKFNNYLFKVGSILMITSLPFIIVLIIFQIQYLLEAGYLSIYNGDISNVAYPIPFLSYVTYPFFYGFCLICSAVPTQKIFNRFFIILFCISIFESFKGGRFSLVAPILYFFWFSTLVYRTNFKLKKLLIPLVLLISLISFLTLNREKSESSVDLNKVAFSIIASQGRSVQLFSLYLENKAQVENYGKYMITSNLLLPYLVLRYPSKIFQSQNTETVMISNNFKDIITYVLSPDYYLSGGGMGGTYIVELYELGLLFSIFFSFIFGIFLYNLSKLTIVSAFFRFISYFLFLYIFIMPRAEALPNFLNLIKLGFVYLLLKFVFVFYNKIGSQKYD